MNRLAQKEPLRRSDLIGTAKKVRDMRRNWHKGSSLYELSQPVEVNAHGFLTETRFVVVAFTPQASDHGLSETTVFAANRNGTLFGNFWDRTSANPEDHVFVERMDLDDGSEFRHCRVVGELNHEAALRKLGFDVTPA